LKRWTQLFILAYLFCVSAVASYADIMDTSGMAAWETCALCHGANGVSAMSKFPKLANQKADYLKRQFLAFKQGHRKNDGGQMQAISTELSSAQLDEATHYFANLIPPAADTTLDNLTSEAEFNAMREWGKKLFNEGKNTLPACASCHAQADSPAPWLDAQHADYVRKQLLDFSNGHRKSLQASGEREELSMADVASGLSPQEIDAVAIYLQSISLRMR
jgi:cytochrome c553